MDAAAPLVKKLTNAREELTVALGSPEFYIELLMVGLAVALAWLIMVLVRRRTKDYLAKHPPHNVDPGFIVKAVSLLAPILSITYLNVAWPLVANYVGGAMIDAGIKLCVAWLIASTVLAVVKSRLVAHFASTLIVLGAVLQVSGFMKSIVSTLDSTEFEVGKFKITLLNLTHGLIILVVVFWLAGALSRTLEGYLRRSSTLNYSTRELIAKFFRIFVYFLALMITLSAMGVDLTAFAVFGGALGVGIGLGLQKITANFVSGITLLMEKSIKLGDLIEVGGVTGWVRQLNVRYALIETSDGRELLIPNDELISTRVTNWTYSNDLARIEIKVGVSYDTDAQLARKLMLEAAREHKRCLKTPEPTCWMREFGDSSIIFQLTFWIPDVNEGRNGPQSDVMFTILEKFKANGIDIPLPQRVMRTAS